MPFVMVVNFLGTPLFGLSHSFGHSVGFISSICQKRLCLPGPKSKVSTLGEYKGKEQAQPQIFGVSAQSDVVRQCTHDCVAPSVVPFAVAPLPHVPRQLLGDQCSVGPLQCRPLVQKQGQVRFTKQDQDMIPVSVCSLCPFVALLRCVCMCGCGHACAAFA